MSRTRPKARVPARWFSNDVGDFGCSDLDRTIKLKPTAPVRAKPRREANQLLISEERPVLFPANPANAIQCLRHEALGGRHR